MLLLSENEIVTDDEYLEEDSCNTQTLHEKLIGKHILGSSRQKTYFTTSFLEYAKKPLSVLIVDDSPYNLLVLNELLKTISKVTSVSTALNGELAMEAILR